MPEKNNKGFDELVDDISKLENIITSWDEQQRSVLETLRDSIEHLHKQAFSQLIRLIKGHPEGTGILKEALTDEVIYGVLRHLAILKPSLSERLEDALDSVRPFLRDHNGGVELVSIDSSDTVSIRLLGACDGCPASGLTLEEGVHKAIKEYCPEIINIKQVKGGLSASSIAIEDISSPFAAKENWINALSIDDIKDNNFVTISLSGRELLLSRYDNKINCFENFCAHMGMPLDNGTVEGDILTCPHHGFRYCLSTGECLSAPEIQLQKIPIRIIEKRVEVNLT